MAPLDRPGDDDLLVAFRHPLRRLILRLMADGKKEARVSMPRCCAPPLSKVSYRVRALAENHAMKPVATS